MADNLNERISGENLGTADASATTPVNTQSAQSSQSEKAAELTHNAISAENPSTAPASTQSTQSLQLEQATEAPRDALSTESLTVVKPKRHGVSPAVWISAVAAAVVIALSVIFVPKLLPQPIIDEPVQAEQTQQSEPVTETTATPISEPVQTEPAVEPPELLPRELPESSLVKSIKAEKTQGDLVETDTAFTITAVEDLSADELKNCMSVTPEMPFELLKTESCTYSLKYSAALPKAAVVKLSVYDDDGAAADWAFQTVDAFRIVSVLPADESNYVPCNSGIEIKLTSAADTDKAAEYFEIKPELKGHFESYRTTLVYVPDENMQTNTFYSVNIKAGLLSVDGVPLEEGRTFSFKTRELNDATFIYSSNAISETFLPDDCKAIELYNSKNFYSSNFNVKLYSYDSSDAYYKALEEYIEHYEEPIRELYYYEDYVRYGTWTDGYEFPVDKLTEVYSTVDKLQTANKENSSPSFLMLPDNLGEGWYIADITTKLEGKDYHIQKLIQVSSVSVYAATLSQQSVFFINDTETGKAVSNASIELTIGENTFTAATDKNGLAKLSYTNENENCGLITIKYGGKVFYDKLDCRTDRELSPNEKYYTYIYTDREAYMCSDTIQIWGLIRPRTINSPAIPTELNVMFGYGEEDGIKAPIKLYEDGTFTAEISYKSYDDTWYMPIKLMSGDTELCSKSVMVRDYEKPVYVLNATAPETVWMPHKNSFEASIYATFFDGTAASELTFEAVDDRGARTQLTTDVNGNATVSAKAEDRDSWKPYREHVWFRQTGIEDNYQSEYAHYYAFHRDTMLETEYDEDTCTLKLSAHKIIEQAPTLVCNTEYDYSYYNYKYENLRGEPANTTVTGVLKRSWYTKTKNASRYDFITKQRYDSYTYTRHEATVGTFTASTVNGIGEFSSLPANIPGSSYWIELTYKDSLGQTVKQTTSLNNYEAYYHSRELNRKYFTLQANKRRFKEDETLSFTLRNDNNSEELIDGRIFYSVYSSDFLSLNIADSANFEHKMTADYIPNVEICGAYFDGKHIYPINNIYTTYSFNPEERELVLDVQKSKDVYKPGDTASVTVTAKDKNGGNAVNTAVSLSVVDEAAFALLDQKAEPLERVYDYVLFPSVQFYYSYIQHSFDQVTWGEKGGGEDDSYVRKDFKDNAAFLTGTTDSSGRVTFTFMLPDNLTTWRATVQAVGEAMNGRLCVGTTRAPIVVSQPLFLIPITLDKYVEGDDIAVSATCVGSVDKSITLTAQVTGTNFDRTLTASSKGTFNFGKLPLGSYKVLFRASDGINSDAIELPFEVVETRQQLEVLKNFDLNSEPLDINPLSWPISLTFRNKEYMFCGEMLGMLSSCHGNNLDYRIARAYALKEYGYYTDEEFISRFDGITSDGLAQLLSYSENDYELTALICAAVPELVDKTKTAAAFYEKLSDTEATSEEVASCYLGLAGLSEPVLNDMIRLLEKPDGLKYDDKLMLCAGLALLGDDSSAMKYYTELTGDITIYKDKESGKALAMLNDSQGSTRLALIAASALNLREADAMARWLYNAKRTEYSCVLELITYLRFYVPETQPDAVVEYTLNGERVQRKLEKYWCDYACFGEEQFKNADFKVISGAVYCTAYYDGLTSEQPDAPSVKVTKTYKAENDKGFARGGLVRVTISVRGFDSNYCYAIDDIIPSGARFAYCADGNYADNNGQKVSSYISNINPRFTYYIHIVTEGEFKAEGALVRGYGGKWGESDEQLFKVSNE